jgi:hypothetical protein
LTESREGKYKNEKECKKPLIKVKQYIMKETFRDSCINKTRKRGESLGGKMLRRVRTSGV